MGKQVMELTKDVLNDPDPAGEWARSQLRKQLASHPDDPERAFLEHLIGTRKLAMEQHPLPATRDSAAQLTLPVPWKRPPLTMPG